MYRKHHLLAYFCVILSFNSIISAQASNDWETILSANKGGSNQNSYDLVLYLNPRCPYCHKVIDYLQGQGRVITTKNTQEPGVREELIRTGGKAQVPCLVINGKALYESDEIIKWLKTHP